MSYTSRVNIYRHISEFQSTKQVALTTGTFDGVHIGHRKIIAQLNAAAREISGISVVLSFHPHPRTVLFPDDLDLKLLTTLEERAALLEEAGVDNLIIHPFTPDFSRLSSLEFVRDLLVNTLHTKKLIIGFNHQFGRNREGSFAHLLEFGPLYGFDVEEIPAQTADDVNISSTKIRNALLCGDVATATLYLGRPYCLHGLIVDGNKLGRVIGFPTANIQLSEPDKLIPGNGVYAVLASIEKETYKGMMNIGTRPTVDGQEVKLEVHLFNFHKDIYTKNIQIAFIERLRDEEKFADLELLKTKLTSDAIQALKLLSTIHT